jgi:hypothetical protein
MQTLNTLFVSFKGSHLTERTAIVGHQIAILDQLTTGRKNKLLSYPASKYAHFTESFILILIVLVMLMKKTHHVI